MPPFACDPQESPPDAAGSWVGTITTEGNVTTVVNESGSVWGGTATLVEEASIGVESGSEEYLLGYVGGVFATDEHIYVLDTQAPQVRMYDLAGEHVADLGKGGQGPGEYSMPWFVAADSAGRVFVLDAGNGRFNVYSGSGEYLATWPAQDVACCAYPMVVSPAGTLFARTRVRNQEARTTRVGLLEYGPEGPIGTVRWPPEIDYTRAEIDLTFRGRSVAFDVPFGPTSMWIASASGDIVAGASDRYRFEIQGNDGAVILVERYWDPVRIGSAEAEWHRRFFVAGLRTEVVPPEWTWDGAEMPSTKPAFSGLVPTTSGDTWVIRQGAGEQQADCVENPIEAVWMDARDARCWRNAWILDVFGADGRYLGEVQSPPDIRPNAVYLFVRGEMVIAVTEDEAGTIMVKRYRLVLPGER